jgi:hypothetical protein
MANLTVCCSYAAVCPTLQLVPRPLDAAPQVPTDGGMRESPHHPVRSVPAHTALLCPQQAPTLALLLSC